MLERTGAVKTTFLLGLQSQHIVVERLASKRTEQHKMLLSARQLPAVTYLEANKDVSHLLFGQSVPKAL